MFLSLFTLTPLKFHYPRQFLYDIFGGIQVVVSTTNRVNEELRLSFTVYYLFQTDSNNLFSNKVEDGIFIQSGE